MHTAGFFVIFDTEKEAAVPHSFFSVYHFFIPQHPLQPAQPLWHPPEQAPLSGQPMHFLPLFFALYT